MLEIIAASLIFIFPAYCANAAPVIFGGGQPLDFGKTLRDDKPIFGAHKTIRGFTAGLVFGLLAGIGESLVWTTMTPLLAITLSLGALMGDLAGAFIKRRLGLRPGALFPVVDQIDFILGGILFSLPIFSPTLTMVLVILLLTVPIHLLTNFVAFLAHIKKSPW